MADAPDPEEQEEQVLREIERLHGDGPQAIADKYNAQLTVSLTREVRRLNAATRDAIAPGDRQARSLAAFTIVLIVLTLVLVVRALQGH